MLDSPKKLYNPHRITVDDFHRMAEAAILSADARVELIEGEIIDMAPIGSRHAALVNRLTRELVLSVRGAAIVSVQNPIILGDLSQPEPDFALLKPKANDYNDSLPEATDILLLIEIADSTLDYDRKIKTKLYARFDILEYWLIDAVENSVTLFQKPLQGKYTIAKTLLEPAHLSPLQLQDVKLNLGKLLS